jgi:hypothetical protein
MYPNVSLQIANKLGNLKKKKVYHATPGGECGNKFCTKTNEQRRDNAATSPTRLCSALSKHDRAGARYQISETAEIHVALIYEHRLHSTGIQVTHKDETNVSCYHSVSRDFNNAS